jgi:predicted metal-dependent peptidase
MMQPRLRAVDPQTSDAARTRLQAARAHAIAALTPYFGSALSAMVMHEVPSLGTVATDTRWRFYYDPAVVAQWSLGMCAAAWLHELKHNLHRHSERFAALGEPADRHTTFNIAADALINEDLKELAHTAVFGGFDPAVIEMGRDWVYLSSLPVPAERSMATEQIYRMLLEAVPCPQGGAGDDGDAAPHDCGSGAGSRHDRWWELPQDDGRDGSVDEGRGDLIAHDAARQVAAHARQSGRGAVPAGFQRWAQQVLDPVVDWRAQLRSLVSNRCAAIAGRRDYTYQRPSRRTAPRGLILPSMRDPAPPSGAVVLDTSGSMSHEELAQGVAEIAGILKQVSRGRSQLQVIACDAAAAQARAIHSASDVALIGGGGTDMRVGIDAAAELRPRVDFVVIFTDGDTPWPEAPPEQNPSARYIAVLSDGPRGDVPQWMRTVVVADCRA